MQCDETEKIEGLSRVDPALPHDRDIHLSNFVPTIWRCDPKLICPFRQLWCEKIGVSRAGNSYCNLRLSHHPWTATLLLVRHWLYVSTPHSHDKSGPLFQRSAAATPSPHALEIDCNVPLLSTFKKKLRSLSSCITPPKGSVRLEP